jgi:hypothetical protein
VAILLIALLVVAVAPSDAWRGGGGYSGGGGYRGGGHFHGRGFVGPRVFVGPVWWGAAAYPWWYYGAPYYGAPYYGPPYYAYTPPPVVQESPSNGQAAQAQAPQQPQAYWYYCASAGAYYPTAPSCPEVWIKVPPRSE